MYTVGLTGGIGSGKSAAAEVFKKQGICVVNADEIARIVVEPGTSALKKIAGHFGEHVIQEDGRLDRRALRELVFDDQDELKWLENLLHPLINREIKSRLEAASSSYSILESPLLIETGQYKMVDRVLVIDAPKELQLKRASQRDDNDQAQIRAIMASQSGRHERLEKADDIITNDKDLESLRKSVMSLHANYLKLAENQITDHDSN